MLEYQAGLRTRRIRYVSTLAIVAVCVLAGVAVAYAVGTQHREYLQTAASAAPTVPLRPVQNGRRLSVRWQSPDATAAGQPLAGGTVVTYSATEVSGRSAATGTPMWRYRPGDSTICAVTQEQGKTLVLHSEGGNCDVLNALDTATGARAWQRTLFKDGMAITGHPQLVARSDDVFVLTSSALYAVGVSADPCDSATGLGCGGDSWTYKPADGCSMQSIAVGANGVLIGQRCGSVGQLVLRDRSQGTDDKNTRIFWTISSTGIPAATDTFIGAVDPTTGALTSYDLKTGKVLHTVTLGAGAVDRVDQVASEGRELLKIGEQVYGVNSAATKVLWNKPLLALPTEGSTFSVTATAVESFVAATGKAKANYPAPVPPGTTTVMAVGAGFLLGGTSTTVVG